MSSVNFKEIPIEEQASLLKSGVAFIDVRTDAERQLSSPTGSKFIPLHIAKEGATGKFPGKEERAEFTSELQAMVGDKSASVIFMCKTGGRSKRACELAIEAGYTTVLNATGGFTAWTEKGLEITQA
jgi:rhodanese-related sulfurtransferase